MSQEEKPLSPLEAKISQAYRVNEAVEDEQREIEVRLNKIEGLKPLLPNRKCGQKWEDLEFGISTQSLIERGDAPLAVYLNLLLVIGEESKKLKQRDKLKLKACKKQPKSCKLKMQSKEKLENFVKEII